MTRHADSTRLLVGVRDALETLEARAAGADVLNLTNPERGPMGEVDPDTLAAVVRDLGDAASLAVCAGEVASPLAEAWVRALPAEACFVLAGVSGTTVHWRAKLTDRRKTLGALPFVPVAYVDHHRAAAPPAERIVEWACYAGVHGILIDTCLKDGHGLLDWIPLRNLTKLVRRAHEQNLLVALGGMIDETQLPLALEAEPDIIAVRSAVCVNGDRRQPLDPHRVRRFRDLLDRHSLHGAASVH